MEKEKFYYIQNGYVGNAILWWAENSHGYTTDFRKAGKYTEEETLSLFGKSDYFVKEHNA